MSGQTNAFEMAQQQFDKVADQLGLDEQVRQILRWPAREYHMRLPVRMDDGKVRVFEAYRVQHNDARGPNKGGLRFHPAETADTVAGAFHVDDLEMRCRRYPLGGGRAALWWTPPRFRSRKKTPVPGLCARYVPQHQSAPGRTRAGRWHHPR